MYLLGKVFFRLFLSWATNIRVIFHNLLVYRISLQSCLLRLNSNLEQSPPGSNNNTNDDIRTRYKKLMAILKEVQEVRQEDIVSKLASHYEKDYFKRMRNKLLDRKRNKGHELHSNRRLKINVEGAQRPRS